jgi:hypothetical protein
MSTSSSLPEATPEMLAAALGSSFQCCVCKREHESLEQDEVYKCVLELSRQIHMSGYEYGYYFSTLASTLMNVNNVKFANPKFDVRHYSYVLAAPSIEEAQKFILARKKEWMEHWQKFEEEILDPSLELPAIKTTGKAIWLKFGQHLCFMHLRNWLYLRRILKDEFAVHVAYALMKHDGSMLLDVQWKKIGDPGTLLLGMPDGTPVLISGKLISGKHVLEILPKEIRTVSEALAHLDGKEEP